MPPRVFWHGYRQLTPPDGRGIDESYDVTADRFAASDVDGDT
jgi:hypothetical protein